MRILVFHGYLLGGTGSNVYNSALAESLAGPATRSTCSARTATRSPRTGSTRPGTGTAGRWRSASAASPPRATVYRPDIGGLLPLYVADRYEGIDARPFPELSDEELERYLERNVAAVREVAAAVRPDVALANHLVMGPAILARALEGGSRTRSRSTAARWSTRSSPTRRFMPYAAEGLAGAGGVLVGSRHTAESLWEAMGDAALRERTRLGPPGVDVAPLRAARAAPPRRGGLAALRDRLAATRPPAPRRARLLLLAPTGEAAEALATVGPETGSSCSSAS